MKPKERLKTLFLEVVMILNHKRVEYRFLLTFDNLIEECDWTIKKHEANNSSDFTVVGLNPTHTHGNWLTK